MVKKEKVEYVRPSILERSQKQGEMNEIDIPLAHSQIGNPNPNPTDAM